MSNTLMAADVAEMLKRAGFEEAPPFRRGEGFRVNMGFDCVEVTPSSEYSPTERMSMANLYAAALADMDVDIQRYENAVYVHRATGRQPADALLQTQSKPQSPPLSPLRRSPNERTRLVRTER